MDPQVSDNPIDSFLQQNKLTVILILIGVFLIGLGFLGVKIFQFSATGPKVEILGSEDQQDVGSVSGMRSESEVLKITVEASGEVIKPGVYELVVGSRVNDLLTVAGGLSVDADREWVSKNINLAQKLSDGAKIYVPKAGNTVGKIGETRKIGGIGNKININSASESELDTLAGVGEVTAKKIIAGRPYQTTEELVSKKVVNKGVWEKIKDEISVY